MFKIWPLIENQKRLLTLLILLHKFDKATSYPDQCSGREKMKSTNVLHAHAEATEA
jgi:hypothetical protein